MPIKSEYRAVIQTLPHAGSPSQVQPVQSLLPGSVWGNTDPKAFADPPLLTHTWQHVQVHPRPAPREASQAHASLHVATSSNTQPPAMAKSPRGGARDPQVTHAALGRAQVLLVTVTREKSHLAIRFPAIQAVRGARRAGVFSLFNRGGCGLLVPQAHVAPGSCQVNRTFLGALL